MVLILRPSDETYAEYNLLQSLYTILVNQHMHPEVEMSDIDAKAAMEELKSAMEEMSH